MNIGVVYQFCKLVTSKISDPRLGDRVCTYYAESDGPRRTNAAFLLGAYLIIMHGWTPEDANSAFAATLHFIQGPVFNIIIIYHYFLIDK